MKNQSVLQYIARSEDFQKALVGHGDLRVISVGVDGSVAYTQLGGYIKNARLHDMGWALKLSGREDEVIVVLL